MTDDRRADAKDKLEALRQAFAGRLRQRVEEVRDAVEAACAGEEGAVAHTESLAHKLSGTAGSYGFTEVGEVAAELEALCQAGFEPARARALIDHMLTAMP
jgi:HPt (histidine-containing phosphotransfer) domain-containing protein